MANSLAERSIASIKELVHKAAHERPSSWHQYLDYALWALREVPQTSLGIPPWTMAFGFLPRGPCAILKEMWLGEKPLPFELGKSEVDYLYELRKNLAKAKEFATSHAERVQSDWAARYNLRARPKSFHVGESVMILMKDQTSSRMRSRWKAPATVIDSHPYIVESDGAHVDAEYVDMLVCRG